MERFRFPLFVLLVLRKDFLMNGVLGRCSGSYRTSFYMDYNNGL